MAKRTSGANGVLGPLDISSCRSVPDKETELWTSGNDVISVKNDAVTVLGSATCTYPVRIHCAS